MQIPETVNLHIWPKCNLACRYCYGSFPDRPVALRLPEWRRILAELARAGVERVTFSGGEPTLHPDIDQLVAAARSVRLVTAIVTNGARLSDRALAGLDLVALSIDSADDEVQRRIGRSLPGDASYAEHIRATAKRVRDAGCRLKLNTVVTALNAEEEMSAFVLDVLPAKWKPLQFVSVAGENDAEAPGLEVTSAAFAAFVERHAHVARAGIWYAPESASTIRATYAMIDPTGRVFQHRGGGHVFSRPVAEIGLRRALEEVGGYDRDAFVARGGHVDVRRLPLLGRTS